MEKLIQGNEFKRQILEEIQAMTQNDPILLKKLQPLLIF